jgi:hypothetical protein
MSGVERNSEGSTARLRTTREYCEIVVPTRNWTDSTFSGAGVGSIVLLPWLQTEIVRSGWRSASVAIGIVVLVILLPLNFLPRCRLQDLGLAPADDRAPQDGTVLTRKSYVVDPVWAARNWTLRRRSIWRAGR